MQTKTILFQKERWSREYFVYIYIKANLYVFCEQRFYSYKGYSGSKSTYANDNPHKRMEISFPLIFYFIIYSPLPLKCKQIFCFGLPYTKPQSNTEQFYN